MGWYVGSETRLLGNDRRIRYQNVLSRPPRPRSYCYGGNWALASFPHRVGTRSRQGGYIGRTQGVCNRELQGAADSCGMGTSDEGPLQGIGKSEPAGWLR